MCQILFEKFNYKILGLECDPERVKTAKLRQEKLFPSSRESVKFLPHFITESSWEFIRQELSKAFQIDPEKISLGLVGLHACGDLTVTSMRIFATTEAIRTAIVMPCCYHKMSIGEIGDKPVNFPLSQRLMGSFGRIPRGDGMACRPFLRLACQQPASRWKKMTEEEHKIHGKNMFQRAMLDAMVEEGHQSSQINVISGKILIYNFVDLQIKKFIG